MLSEEVIKNNELIAEFMGGILKSNRFEIPKGYIWLPFENMCKITNLKYNSSWDWLMPVVNKMFKLEYICIFYGNHCCIQNKLSFTSSEQINKHPYYIDAYSLNEDNLINAVFETIVEFIKWYNTW